jgi:hypothetical protein
MRSLTLSFLAAVSLAACGGSAVDAPLGGLGRYQVTGVEDDDDMLKMRAGPGTGYIIVLGMPNGTSVWVDSCEPSGNTSWCKVTLGGAGGVEGYVSKAYLKAV